jgi:hypothetical protein
MQLSHLDSFRREIVGQLHEAAQEAKVELLPIDVAVSVRGEIVVANAIIAPPPGTPPEYAQKMFLIYLSLPEKHEMAKKIPRGCYIVEQIPNSPTPQAKLVNLKGEAVLYLPLNRVRTELPSGAYHWTSGDPPIVHSQAHIEQAYATLYRDIIIEGHGIICYPGVWYWTWVIIVIVARAAEQ